MSSLAPWRVAARLARRETLRRPGRTVLVALLVAVPVMGMVAANVLSRTNTRDWRSEFRRTAGDADILLQLSADQLGSAGSGAVPTDQLDDELAALLPTGSTWETEFGRWSVPIRSADRSTEALFVDVDLEAPIRREVIELRTGRAPSTAGEVALDRRTADRFGVDVGDRLVLEHPRGTWTVTGIARLSYSFDSALFVTRHFDWSRASAGWSSQTSIVVRDGAAVEPVAELLRAEFGNELVSTSTLSPYGVPPSDAPTGELAWGWVFGAVALAVLGVIIAAAFATSARRQLVSIGQLSANGADRSLLRLTLALQGSWSGIVGVATGTGLAAIALAGGRPVVERLAGRRLPPFEFAVSDLAVIALIGVLAASVAALVPAWSASRVPVMAALAGRRPLGRVPRRLVPLGLLAFAAGLVLLVMASSATAAERGDEVWTLVALLGGVLVLCAVVCTAPLAIDLLGAVCARAPGAWRLGGRSLARTRARAAGVVAAVAAMTALVVAGTTIWASATRDEWSPRWMPLDVVSASVCTTPVESVAAAELVDFPTTSCAPPTGALRAALDTAIGTAEVHVVRAATWDPAPFNGAAGPPPEMLLDGSLTIADPFLIDLIGMSSADRSLLDEVGAIVLDDPGANPVGPLDTSNSSERMIETEAGDRVTLRVARITQPFESTVGTTGILVSPMRALGLELPIVDERTVFVLPGAVSRAVNERLLTLAGGTGQNDVFDRPDGVPVDEASTDTYTRIDLPARPLTNDVVVELALSLVATLLTLIVVTIGLALSAIESRDERDVLAAVGAPPRVLRGVASRKAFLLSFTGAIIAVPAGLLPVIVVLITTDRSGLPLSRLVDVPWLTLVALVIGVPLVASTCASVTSAVAQRVRPVTMSTLRAD